MTERLDESVSRVVGRSGEEGRVKRSMMSVREGVKRFEVDDGIVVTENA